MFRPTPFHHLPIEILMMILISLPVKYLLRFRAVCKEWCSLIDNSSFVNDHIKFSLETNTNSCVVLRSGDNDLCYVDLDSPDVVDRLENPFGCNCEIRALDSWNGLLCLFAPELDEFVCWNPSTHEYKRLPRPHPSYGLVSSYGHGFGYDGVNDDYKVLSLTCYDASSDHNCLVYVYSLKSNSWREKEEFCFSYSKFNGLAVFACGALHWILTDEEDNYVGAFDVETEDCHTFSLPLSTCRLYKFNRSGLANLSGCLSLICESSDHFEIWMMKDYGVKESWTKSLVNVGSTSLHQLTPIAYSKSGKDLLLERRKNGFTWFDIRNKTFRDIDELGTFTYVNVCLGTLVKVVQVGEDTGQEV